jgi:hypothetical protein
MHHGHHGGDSHTGGSGRDSEQEANQ